MGDLLAQMVGLLATCLCYSFLGVAAGDRDRGPDALS